MTPPFKLCSQLCGIVLEIQLRGNEVRAVAARGVEVYFLFSEKEKKKNGEEENIIYFMGHLGELDAQLRCHTRVKIVSLAATQGHYLVAL